MQLEWQDQRVKCNGIDKKTLLNMETALKELWLPDIWVESLRDFQVHRSIKDQAKLEMDNQSNFYYWQSVTATVSCPMNFALYPFDCQRCSLRFSSSRLTFSSSCEVLA